MGYTIRTEHWEKQAAQTGKQWFAWHWNTYNVFCGRDGDHSTPAQGYVNWNQELIWKMRTELELQWEILEEEMVEELRTLEELLITELNDLKDRFTVIGFENVVDRAFELQIQSLVHEIGKLRHKYAKELRIVRRKASEGNVGSYMVKEMIPAYRSAVLQSGT
jgi:hypothetical protein